MSAGSNVPPGGQPLPVPSSGGAAPGTAPAKSKTWLWVALGCGGCALLGGVVVVVVAAFGLFAARHAETGMPGIVSSTGSLTWTAPAKSCSETCSRVISCEKKQAAADPDAGYQVESQADCEKDCGGNLQDEPYHCLSQATDCDTQEGCESGD